MIIKVTDLSNEGLVSSLEKLSESHATVRMNLSEYVRILENNTHNLSTKFRAITSREILHQGIYGYIGPMQLSVTKSIPSGDIEVDSND